jgi:hypothetical protein
MLVLSWFGVFLIGLSELLSEYLANQSNWVQPNTADLLSEEVQNLDLDITQVPFDRSFVHLRDMLCILLGGRLRLEALNELDESSLVLPATIVHLLQLLLIFSLERIEPVRNLVHVVLSKYLIHFIVCSVKPSSIRVLRCRFLLDTIEATEASLGITLQLVQSMPILILITFPSLAVLLALSFAHSIRHLVLAVCSKPLQVFIAASSRIGVSNTGSSALSSSGRERHVITQCTFFLSRYRWSTYCHFAGIILGLKGKAICAVSDIVHASKVFRLVYFLD